MVKFGKNSKSIVVGEAFKKYYANQSNNKDLSKTPGSLSSGKIVVVVPARQRNNMKSILGSLYSIIMSQTEQDKKQKEQLINVLYKDLKKNMDKFENAQKERNKNLQVSVEV